MLKDIRGGQPFLRLYPAPEEVFAEPFEKHARHFLPLVSIDLSVVDPQWSGWLPLVNTVEPYEEVVGVATGPFHSVYARENWVGFQLTDEGRLKFLGDWRYFFLENPPGTLAPCYEADREEMEKHYAEQHAGIGEARERFAELGEFYTMNHYASQGRDFSQEKPGRTLVRLGGKASAGNWAYSSDFPLDRSDEEDVRPLTPEGVPFHFVASVHGWDYCASGADEILLFWEPQSRVVLLTFDWT